MDKVLKKEQIDDGGKVVGTKKGDSFVITVRSSNGCNIYNSSLLQHLLAFERWCDK
jgi:tRNA threonylcarbamoyladenosine modification (KEOPS) complex Cgi121 subunit